MPESTHPSEEEWLGAGTLALDARPRRRVVGTDTGTEARPSPYSWLAPFHAVAMVAMVAMGLRS